MIKLLEDCKRLMAAPAILNWGTAELPEALKKLEEFNAEDVALVFGSKAYTAMFDLEVMSHVSTPSKSDELLAGYMGDYKSVRLICDAFYHPMERMLDPDFIKLVRRAQ